MGKTYNKVKKNESPADKTSKEVTIQCERMRNMRVGGSSTSSQMMPSKNINQERSSQVGTSETVKINNEVKAQQNSFKETGTVNGEKYSEKEIIDFIEESNEKILTYNRKFEFSIHEKTKKIMVKVLDTSTDEIIREIPAEKFLDVIGGLQEIAGMIVDKKI